MVRSEESKRLWLLAEAARDFEAMDKIEAEWKAQVEPEPHIDYPGDDDEFEDDGRDHEMEAYYDWRDNGAESPWTDEDEAGLEDFEDNRRRRIAEANEF